MEGRELTPVESDKVKSLALLALQVGTLDEAGNHSQATSGRNVLGLSRGQASTQRLLVHPGPALLELDVLEDRQDLHVEGDIERPLVLLYRPDVDRREVRNLALLHRP